MKITRKEFEEMLAEPDLDLNPIARGILQAYAQHMNYKPSPVAAYKTKEQAGIYAGCSEATAKDYIEALVEDGFLIDSGQVKTTKNYKSMPYYFIGRGTPTNTLIRRPQGRNSKNLKKGNPDGVGLDSPDAVGLDNPDGKPEQPRRETGATPTGSGRTTYMNNNMNNPSNNQEGADAPEPQTDEPDGSSYPEGTTEDSKNFKKDDQPSYLSEEPGSALSPTTEGAATPTGSGLSYEEQAEAGGFGQKYNDYLKVPGFSKKRAYEKAKEHYERGDRYASRKL